jgi:glutamate-1-semialdehyde 2,1-aminomutase
MSMAELKPPVNRSLGAALAEAEERYVRANPGSAAHAADAAASLPGGNTRTTLHYSPFPLVLRSGQGSTVTDVDGHRYVDFINEHTAGLFGHSNPVIGRAIEQALEGGLVLGGPNVHEHRLAAEIIRRFPAVERLRFCNSGTEANLLALSTARAVTGKTDVMVFDGAYHGSLIYFGHGASPMNVPFPYVRSQFNDPERAAADIARHAGRLAAVIVEPMQGGAGALPGEPDFLRALREACDRHEVLLVFDEVMTSRLGHGGVQGLLGIRPDLTSLGKYIGGGLTVGAFGGRAEIMDRFDPSRPDAFPHGGTFNNNVLAMAAGHAALSRILTPEASERLNALGDRLRDGINARAEQHGLPVVATGLGSILGLHFHRGPARNEADLDAFERGRVGAVRDLKKLFQYDMFERGQYVTRRILMNLSLETTEQQVADLLGCIDEFFATRGPLIRDALS